MNSSKKILNYHTILLACILVFFLACAGSRNGDSIIEEASFSDEQGEVDSQIDNTTGESSDEDEVLRLLGISKNEQGTTGAPANLQDEDVDNLESQVQQLENETKRKNTEVANLRTELSERDRRIKQLQQELETIKPEDSGATNTRSATFKVKYESALAIYNNRKYRQAIQEFKSLLATDVSNSLIDNCQYWLGECHYGLSDFNQAIIEFEKVFSFSNSDKWDDAQLKLGICYLRIGLAEKAKREFEKLITDYPDSEYIPKARSYLMSL